MLDLVLCLNIQHLLLRIVNIAKNVQSVGFILTRSFALTLKYSTRPRQVILLPLISFTSMLRGLSSQGTRTFRLFMNSPSISGQGGKKGGNSWWVCTKVCAEIQQCLLCFSLIWCFAEEEKKGGKYQHKDHQNTITHKTACFPRSQKLPKTPKLQSVHHLLMHNS